MTILVILCSCQLGVTWGKSLTQNVTGINIDDRGGGGLKAILAYWSQIVKTKALECM